MLVAAHGDVALAFDVGPVPLLGFFPLSRGTRLKRLRSEDAQKFWPKSSENFSAQVPGKQA